MRQLESHCLVSRARFGSERQRTRVEGYSVVVATEAIEGARTALAEPPAAVIADLWMPSISGVQVCRLLRSQAPKQEIGHQRLLLSVEHLDVRLGGRHG